MFRFFLVIAAVVFATSCSQADLRNVSTDSPSIYVEPTASPVESSPSEVESSDYPGKTIDQMFPIISDHDFSEPEFKERDFDIDALGYKVSISHLAPVSIKKNSRTILKFKTRHPPNYWSNLVGVSSVLGPASKEIYAVSTGPGAVCCTNYWIIAVSSGRPRSIFRSEDFGNFRGPMEIFDYEKDGTYELVQFDSCFRYFMGDCGSCSPEPRVYFKYDRSRHRYRPAPGIQQEFVEQSMQDSERSIVETYKQIQRTSDEREQIALEYDFNRSLLDHVVQLIHLGQEEKGWKLFKRYGNDADGRVRREMRKRLAGCMFYQALRQHSVAR